MIFIYQNLINLLELVFFIVFFTLFGISMNRIIFREKFKFISFVEANSLALITFFIFISIWNLFFSINILTFFILSIPIFIESINILKLSNWTRSKNKDQYIKKTLYFLITLFLVWIANLGLQSPKYEPFYYIQKIRWAQQFPIVPGMGNLFDHYGIDNSLFLQIAFFDNIPFVKYSLWNFTGYILFIGFFYFLIIPLYNIILSKKSYKSSSLVALLFFPVFINNCFTMHPGIYTDLPVFIFGSIMGIELYKVFVEEKADYSLLLISLFLAFSAKLSFLPFFSASFLILFSLKRESFYNFFKKNRTLSILIPLAFLLQIYRNVLLTGYFVYPIDKIPLPVQWKVEKNEANQISDNFFSKGLIGIAINIKKNNDEVSLKQKIEWLKGRFLLSHNRIETLHPLIIGLFGLFINLYKTKLILIKRLVLYSIPAIAQILNFILLAPDNRFVSFATWCFASGMIAIPLKHFLSFNKKYFLILLFTLLIYSISIHKVDFLGTEKEFIIKKVSKKRPEIPRFSIFTTESGLKLNVPLDGEKCDDCPLPCTMTPKKKLSLIVEGSITSGFFIEDENRK